jgi:hypothetical protein
LEAAKAGIICLTPSNLHSDWILFEAGALSKTLQNTYVCPFLIGLEPSDVKPPLAQFQATKAQKGDVLKLLKTLNNALIENALPEAHIEEAFDVWWPKLDSQLKSLPTEDSSTKTHRPDRELLDEILALVRNQNRPLEDKVDESLLRARKLERAFVDKVFDMVASIDPGVKSIGFSASDKGYRFTVNSRNNIKYGFDLPIDIAHDEMVMRIKPNVPKELIRIPESSTTPAT